VVLGVDDVLVLVDCLVCLGAVKRASVFDDMDTELFFVDVDRRVFLAFLGGDVAYSEPAEPESWLMSRVLRLEVTRGELILIRTALRAAPRVWTITAALAEASRMAHCTAKMLRGQF
jgi:hypothetical protein